MKRNDTANSELPITLLSTLAEQLGMENKRRALAETLLSEFIDRDETWGLQKSQSAVRCAILAASKTSYGSFSSEESIKQTPISLNALLTGASIEETHAFIVMLKDFNKTVNLDEQPKSEMQRIINNFAFSLTIYNKFKEIWQCLEIEGDPEIASCLKDISWILYILSRINLLQRRTEIIECACMMLGTFQFILTNLPPQITSKIQSTSPDAILKFLCGLLKAQPEQVNVSASHINLMVEKFKEHQVIRGLHANSRNIEGILTASHLEFNLQSLNLYYTQKLLPDDIDERAFLNKPHKNHAKNVTEYSILNNDHNKFINQRTIDFEDNEQISINLKLNDILRLNTSNSQRSNLLYNLSTPMTSAIELESWLSSHIEDLDSNIPLEIKHKLGIEATKIVKNLVADFTTNLVELLDKYGLERVDTSSFIAKNFKEEVHQKSVQSNIRVEMTLKLFYKSLGELMRHEERQLELRSENKDHLTNVLKNENFYRSLLACCLQTILVVYNTLTVDLEEILALCKINAFDLWKLMKNFIEFDPRLPSSVKHYFRILELKIISFYGWKEGSPIIDQLKQHIDSREGTNHPAVLMYYRRFLTYCANRVNDISNILCLQDQMKEEIWSITKNTILEATDIYIDRHTDQVIACTIYGVCKAKSLNITFNTLIAKYIEFYADSGSIFRQVKLTGAHNYGDIIKFYNDVFLRYMKAHLRGISKPLSNITMSQKPTSGMFSQNIPNSLASYYPSPTRNLSMNRTPIVSPFVTPRSKRLYAFGESPSSYALEGINFMGKKTDRHLSFDDDESAGLPAKRPKHIDEVFEETDEINMTLPDDFPGFKDK